MFYGCIHLHNIDKISIFWISYCLWHLWHYNIVWGCSHLYWYLIADVPLMWPTYITNKENYESNKSDTGSMVPCHVAYCPDTFTLGWKLIHNFESILISTVVSHHWWHWGHNDATDVTRRRLATRSSVQTIQKVIARHTHHCCVIWSSVQTIQSHPKAQQWNCIAVFPITHTYICLAIAVAN